MGFEDEILLEQYFTYRGMSIDIRNLCMNIILNTKDVSDSVFCINENSECKYDLLFLHLINSGGSINFDGAVYNNSENRMINGRIIRRNNMYIVSTHVYRLSDCLLDCEKDYTVTDIFVEDNNRFRRKTIYGDKRVYNDEIDLLSDEEISNYLNRKVVELKRK